MGTFINNKSAYIWAFNEMIDTETQFDGNTYPASITETKAIISRLYKSNIVDDNITKTILHTYLEILLRILTVHNIEQVTDNEQYILCGWKEHAILLFWEIQLDGLYNVGFINCGSGIEIQGYN